MTKKRYVRLGRNRRTAFPKRMIFLDTESVVKERRGKLVHYPYLWGACYVDAQRGDYDHPHEEWQFFDRPDDFWKWVVSKAYSKEELYLFTHNPSYDMIAGKIYAMCMKYGFSAKFYHEKGMTYILKIYKDKRKITVLNTGQWYQGKLASIAPLFGLRKGELDHTQPIYSEAVRYNRTDVEIIKRAMLSWFKFCKQHDLGNFGLTPAKQAVNAFRHRFGGEKIVLPNDEDEIRLEREAYFGGRTEAHFIGAVPAEKVVSLDVNSMYPSVMKDFLYPLRFLGYEENISLRRLHRHMRDFLVIARVRVKTNVPCVPVRVRGRIFFPVGEFETALCQPELELVEKYGQIIQVKAACIYEKASLFADYVEFFYQERQKAKREGNKLRDKLLKLLLNSLYGKFAQRSPKWEITGDCAVDKIGYEDVYDVQDDRHYQRKYFLGKVWENVGESEPRDSFPAIAAFVTSYARVVLFQYIYQVGEKHNFYNDTDSLFVDEEGYARVMNYIDPSCLGYLKREEDKHNLVIYGPKDYVWATGVKHKGVPKDARQLSNDTFQYWSWDKTASFLHRQNLVQYENRPVTKKLKRAYLKGWVLDTGWVVPFEMRCSEEKNGIVAWEDTHYAEQGGKLMDIWQALEVCLVYKEYYVSEQLT